MPAPAGPPLGLQLARSAKAVSRAFDDALTAAGGSLPSWLVLLSLKTSSLGNQRELAEAIGIRGATLTHHLDTMEAAGLVIRRRDPGNRRVQLVTLTPSGDAAFDRMRRAAIAFDSRLRTGLSETDVARCVGVLETMRSNVSEGQEAPRGRRASERSAMPPRGCG
jgi:MarR family transcriptional regulator, transcriptional regulator for hemolysin